MGKSGGQRLRTLQLALKTYPTNTGSSGLSLLQRPSSSNMATSMGMAGKESEGITKSDLLSTLKELKPDISKDTLGHPKPIVELLEDIQSTLHQVASTADLAMEMALAAQNDIQQF